MGWNCPDCSARNPDGRKFCRKRGCNGMELRELRKVIALMGMMDNGGFN